MNILERIDKLRVEKDWSFYKLAEESILPQATVSNLFSRKSLPSIPTLTAICNGLGITLSQFFLTEEEKESQDELLYNFAKLSPKDQNAVKNLIKNLVEKDK